jgi:hypothetical protein
MAAARERKKDGAYPFAPLSLASAGCLVADAVGRYAGNRKKDRGAAEERSRTRGGGRPMLSTVDVPAAARVRRPFPRGTDALSPAPNWRLRRSARPGRSVLKPRLAFGPSRPSQQPAAPSPQTDFGF